MGRRVTPRLVTRRPVTRRQPTLHQVTPQLVTPSQPLQKQAMRRHLSTLILLTAGRDSLPVTLPPPGMVPTADVRLRIMSRSITKQ